jgi:hypothetical protein
MENNTKIYCFDLDNTLCITQGSDYENAKPIASRIKKVNDLFDQGHSIIIETARGNVSGRNHYYYTLDQLKNWGLKFHTLRTGSKFNADFFIDDRGVSDKEFFDSNDFKESGSGVNTKLYLVSRVRKEATNERMQKLIDEVKFIENIPEPFRMHFPEITHYGERDGNSYYEMKHYPLPSMRRLIFTNKLSVEDVVSWMSRISAFSVKLHSYEIIETPVDYIKFMHWDRFFTRREELLSNTKVLNEYIIPDKLVINNRELRNAHVIINDLLDHSDDFLPPFVGRWSHSDLHFSNVLIDLDENTFRCVDPRGYPYCDVFYDFGKLYHSVNGKYEMVVNDMWIKNSEFQYELIKNDYHLFLEELKIELVQRVFQEHSPLASVHETMKLIEFNEAIHFITLVPFQLTHDGNENRAKVAYMIGLELLNNFYQKYYE